MIPSAQTFSVAVMGNCVTALSAHANSQQAGEELGRSITAQLGATPNVVLLFVAADHDHEALLEGFYTTCQPRLLIGGTSSGEFTSREDASGQACAVAIDAAHLTFDAAVARGATGDEAARALVESFPSAQAAARYRSRAVFVFADALTGMMEPLVHGIVERTECMYQVFGGGAGADGAFGRRRVFFNREVLAGSAVALTILSDKPIGISFGHSWKPVGERMRVTAVDGNKVLSINARPAADVFRDHAQTIGEHLDEASPFGFFLLNTIGVVGDSGHKIRAPLAINPDRSVTVATEIPLGATVQLMRAGNSVEVAQRAGTVALEALERLGAHRPLVAFAFDCVTTRMRLAPDHTRELDAVRATLSQAPLIGCYTIGQIARIDGQLSDFHNCTTLVAALPA